MALNFLRSESVTCSGAPPDEPDELDDPEECSFPDVGQNLREACHQKSDGFTSQND